MTGSRTGAILLGGLASASLAVVLLLDGSGLSLRPSRPAPSALEAERPGGAAPASPPRPPASPPTAPVPPPADRSPSPERLLAGTAARLLADPAPDAEDRLRALLVDTRAPTGRAAIYRAIRADEPRPRLAALLAAESDPAAIPAAAAALARMPAEEDAVARLVDRAGPARAPDVLEEILALDDHARPEALVAAAAAAPGDAAREKRFEIAERLAGREDVDLAAWLAREPDAEIRERLAVTGR